MNQHTSLLLAAYRTLKNILNPNSQPKDCVSVIGMDKWMICSGSATIEICYDIYDKILEPHLDDYKKGLLTIEEQRMLAKCIEIIAERADFFTRPWDKEFSRLSNQRLQNYLSYLNYCRTIIMEFLNNIHTDNFQQFEQLVAPFIKIIVPNILISEKNISIPIKMPDEPSHKEFEMTILEEDGKLIVSPIVSGSFFFHLGPKKVNIETGELLDKVKYDLYNYTILKIE